MRASHFHIEHSGVLTAEEYLIAVHNDERELRKVKVSAQKDELAKRISTFKKALYSVKGMLFCYFLHDTCMDLCYITV